MKLQVKCAIVNVKTDISNRMSYDNSEQLYCAHCMYVVKFDAGLQNVQIKSVRFLGMFHEHSICT
jgi:hypothetical protein